jgi:hypothetical protein
MCWFTALTGLPDDRPATVRAGMAVQGNGWSRAPTGAGCVPGG